MSDGAYRDPLEGLRARIEALTAQAKAREDLLSEALVAYLPQTLAAELSNLRERVAAPARTREELSAVEIVLGHYLAALERAIAMAPDIEKAQTALPTYAPEPEASTWLRPLGFMPPGEGLREQMASLEKSLAFSVGALTHDATYQRLNDYDWRVRFRVVSTPFSLLAQIAFQNFDGIGEVRVRLATSVAPATPRLVVRPETTLHTLLAKPLRLLSDVDFDDELFDGTFLVQGEPEAARRMLGPEVRRALLEVARFDVPELRVEHGKAEIAFCFEPSARLLGAATQALTAIRRAKLTLSLVNER
jgi:hypothetical protein